MGLKRTILSYFAWAEIATVVIGGRYVMVPIHWLTARKDPNKTYVGRWLRDMAVLCTRLHPMWHFSYSTDMQEPPEGGAVFVSNHCSQADIFLLSHLPWEMKWLAKEELFQKPFFGPMLHMSGDIPLKRGDRRAGVAALEACAEYLERGMSVMIFPEGTRSRDGNLKPFKDGAFKLAIETQKPIVPIAVRGTTEALPKHEWKFGDTHAHASVGQAISTEGMTLDDLEDLKAAAVAQIEAMLSASEA